MSYSWSSPQLNYRISTVATLLLVVVVAPGVATVPGHLQYSNEPRTNLLRIVLVRQRKDPAVEQTSRNPKQPNPPTLVTLPCASNNNNNELVVT